MIHAGGDGGVGYVFLACFWLLSLALRSQRFEQCLNKTAYLSVVPAHVQTCMTTLCHEAQTGSLNITVSSV